MANGKCSNGKCSNGKCSNGKWQVLRWQMLKCQMLKWQMLKWQVLKWQMLKWQMASTQLKQMANAQLSVTSHAIDTEFLLGEFCAILPGLVGVVCRLLRQRYYTILVRPKPSGAQEAVCKEVAWSRVQFVCLFVVI